MEKNNYYLEYIQSHLTDEEAKNKLSIISQILNQLEEEFSTNELGIISQILNQLEEEISTNEVILDYFIPKLDEISNNQAIAYYNVLKIIRGKMKDESEEEIMKEVGICWKKLNNID